MRLLLAISGKQFSGKDTFCDLLLEEVADLIPQSIRPFQRRGFADRMKVDWMLKTGRFKLVADEQPDDSVIISLANHLKNAEAKERTALIEFGEAAKLIDPLVWINRCIEPAAITCSSPHLAIPDTRFRAEIQALVDLDLTSIHRALFVRVNSKRENRLQRALIKGAVLSNEDHASETELDNYNHWDLCIDNDGSLEELRAHARGFAKSLKLQLNHVNA